MRKRHKRVVVLHGANLDMLGQRPAEHYGQITLSELERLIVVDAARLGWRCLCAQTNHEGSYVELLHKYRNEDAIIVNPGAWTHYSYAIRDALELVACPVAEVHLSDVMEREEFRRRSVIGEVVTLTVSGQGPAGYLDALAQVVQIAEADDTR